MYPSSILTFPCVLEISHHDHRYEQGITTFDTADVSLPTVLAKGRDANIKCVHQVYSNGLSEIMLGKAIKKLNLPRDEIVILTKTYQVTARETSGPNVVATGVNPDEAGYANRWGLSRKVRDHSLASGTESPTPAHSPQHIFDAIKGSLERLQLDYVDVLQCKAPQTTLWGQQWNIDHDAGDYRPSI